MWEQWKTLKGRIIILCIGRDKVISERGHRIFIEGDDLYKPGIENKEGLKW